MPPVTDQYIVHGVPLIHTYNVSLLIQLACQIMPFSTDTNWPQGLLNIFNASCNQNTPIKSQYYGPYDRLFIYIVIEDSFNFFLALQIARPNETSAHDIVEFVVFMVDVRAHLRLGMCYVLVLTEL